MQACTAAPAQFSFVVILGEGGKPKEENLEKQYNVLTVMRSPVMTIH